MNLSEFTALFEYRPDLIGLAKAMSVYYARDVGVLVRRADGWWASNDTRWDLVGTVPNATLVQPTVGPHETRPIATKAYHQALEKRLRQRRMKSPATHAEIVSFISEMKHRKKR